MKTLPRRSLLAAALAPALTALAPLAAAQQGRFPSRRLSVVVPFPAGGPADMVARVMSPLLQKALGETVIVENVAGVGGALGVNKVLDAPPDGHTALLTTVAEPILPPLTMPGNVRYKPDDLLLVSQLAYTNIALVVRPGLPIQSVQQLLAHMKNPSAKPLAYATPGSGTLYHLMGEHFKSLVGGQLLHVPYKGLAPAVNDLLGGQVDVAFLPMAGSTAKLIESGSLRALANSAAEPTAGLPRLGDLDGLKEFVYTVWTGVFLPRQAPADAVAAMHRAVDSALQGPEFGAYTKEAGGVALTRAMSLPQAQAFYSAEMQRLTRTFQGVKLKVD